MDWPIGLIKITVGAVLAAAGFLFAVRLLEDRSIFFPLKLIERTPADAGLSFEEVRFKTSDGLELAGWSVRASRDKGGGTPETVPVILYLHGNAGNISHRIEKIKIFAGLGFDVFIFDWRGYGNSPGRPSEEGFYNDARAAHSHLVQGEKRAPESIVLFGESIGGPVAYDLALKERVGAVITENTFTSIPDMARIYYPFIPKFLLKSRFDTLSKAGRVRAPKLILHSADDEIVPFEMARRLVEAAHAPKRFVVFKGDHNGGFFESLDLIAPAIRSFLAPGGDV